MRILLTNDDGISSPGITGLAKSLRDAGHKVFVVAPDTNCSGFSHSIYFLNKPLKIKKIEEDTWACSGTPVDCIIVALLGGIEELNIKNLYVKEDGQRYNLEKAPDLILSGINVGSNLGTDIVFSGTAAAARQGSFFGIPSVALSLVDNHRLWHWEPVIEYVIENLDEFKSYWVPGAFVNINFPNSGKKPLKLVPTFPCLRYYDDTIEPFKAPDGDVYCFAKVGKVSNIPADGSDWREVLNGNAALSVVKSEPILMEKA